MKKLLLVAVVLFCAFLTAAPGIGPGAGGPIGPSPGSGGFVGGTITTPIKGPVSANCSTPIYSFSVSGYDNTGIADITGSENVAVCVNGNPIISTTATGVTIAQPLLAPDGTAAAPSMKFTSDPNSGVYSAGADQVGVSAGGVISGKFTTTGLDLGTLDLTCNQATATVDGITALTAPAAATIAASDGILLRNTTAAATAQEFSPSLRLDGVGYTAGPTNTRQSWAITNKPTSATAGKLALDFASGGGYAEAMSLTQSGAVMVASDISARAGVSSLAYLGTDPASNLVYGVTVSAYAAALKSTLVSSAGSLPIQLWAAAQTHEGSRLVGAVNNTVIKSSIDKDGVYWNAYGSGPFTSVAPLVKTIVTLADDDSTYIVKWFASAIDQSATPAHTAAYECTAVYTRIDGTLTRVAGTAVPELYDLAADITVIDSVSGNSIIMTFTTTTGAITLNGKFWGVSVMKTSNAAYTGVTYPLAN